MNRQRSLLVLAVITSLFVAVVGVFIYYQQAGAIQKQLIATYEVSAEEVARQLSTALKINNIQHIKRAISSSYIGNYSDSLSIESANGNVIYTISENLDSYAIDKCPYSLKTSEIKFGGEIVGILKYCVNFEGKKSHFQLPFTLLGCLATGLLLFTLILWIWHRKSTILFENFLKDLDRLQIQRVENFQNLFGSQFNGTPLEAVRDKVLDLVRRSHALLKQQKQIEVDRALNKISLQVSHDIKSPLIALKILLNATISNDLNCEKSRLLKSAVTRIQNIVKDLDQISKKHLETIDEESLRATAIYPILNTIVNEKKLIASDLDISLKYEANALFACAKIDKIKFERSISNLIQNAIEACDKVDKKINIKLSTKNSVINLKIEDNGKGIPKPLLEKIKDRGFTFGKLDGSGLGLSYANESVLSFGGSIEIISRDENGTTVNVYLPQLQKPMWLSEQISLQNIDEVIMIDDDPSIRTLLKAKISNRICYEFNKFEELEGWMNNSTKTKQRFYFIDQNLNNSSMNGLDFVKKYNLQNNSILITSMYEDLNLQQSCADIGLKIYPKDIIAEFAPSLDV